MAELLTSAVGASAAISPASVLGRLVVAVLLGAVVAWIYRKTRAEHVATFPATLVLLAVLIAMVTQVIGDSVARAFSLVGALSIVRFRTVVRDTQDTAFVIFAVVVGMACGASDPRVALIGIAVVGVAAFAMKPRGGDHGGQQYTLELRVSSGQDLDGEIAAVIDTFVTGRRLLTIGTARQGIALDGTYSVQLRAGQRPEDLVRALNRLEGIQNVTLAARPVDEPQG